MNKEELLKHLSEIKERIFMIDMIEHWQEEDREAYKYWNEEKRKVEKELENIENGE